MKRALMILGLALLAAGCGDSKAPTADTQAANKPAADETKACIVAYLGQCGWQDIELTAVDEKSDMPKDAKGVCDAWAFSFTAHYTNVFGERQKCADWLAVVERADGKSTVRCCFDSTGRKVGGHNGAEGSDVAAIVPPKP